MSSAVYGFGSLVGTASPEPDGRTPVNGGSWKWRLHSKVQHHFGQVAVSVVSNQSTDSKAEIAVDAERIRTRAIQIFTLSLFAIWIYIYVVAFLGTVTT